ncbi:MAG: hypothetical protein B1H12_04810 [Desulfobacteraceae bacterium 4484_190.2]|nr:MAG: hypothetical protein B1H12_04810 [Desulfobacteraceae bacterium 4484_190.2]
MDLVIRRDIRKLLHDAQEVQKGLDMLEQDHDDWARERQQYDLVRLIKRVNRLESDVSMMQSDCMSMGLIYHEDGIWQVVFNDLKQVRTDLSDSYIHPGELKQLEVDWDRLNKTIGQIQKHLQNSESFLIIKGDIVSGRKLKKA